VDAWARFGCDNPPDHEAGKGKNVPNARHKNRGHQKEEEQPPADPRGRARGSRKNPELKLFSRSGSKVDKTYRCNGSEPPMKRKEEKKKRIDFE